MKFCNECQSVMTKSTTAMGVIVFQCRCQLTVEGTIDDTLMAEEYLETAESNLKHDVFIENAPFDLAGNIVLKDCPQCGLNFMTMIQVGSELSTIFSCSCNFRASYDEYMKMINQPEEKNNTT